MNSDKIQMNNYLQNLIPRLEEVKGILLHPQSSEEVTITDAKKLTSFFDDFEDTNQLLFEAEQMARKNLDELERQISILSNAIDPILSADLSIWEDVNFEEIVNSHLKPFDEVYEKAQKTSTKLWRVYQAISNRLDYLPMDSDEYHQLDKECEAAKKAYENAHTITDKSYEALRIEQSQIYHVFFFKTLFVKVLIGKLKQIVDTATRDIKRLRKEGGI